MANTLNTDFNIFINSQATIKTAASDLKYLFRYNIIDEEGKVLSPWSQITELNQEGIADLITGFTPIYSISSVESGGQGINVKWTVPDNFSPPSLDIYFAWSYDNGVSYTDFEYAETVSSNSYYIEIPFQSSIKAKFVKVAVQLPTTKKIVNTNALLFQSTGDSTAPILDAGTI